MRDAGAAIPFITECGGYGLGFRQDYAARVWVRPSRQLPPAARTLLLVGLEAGHREQALEDFEFVAPGKFGEFGRGGSDQDQGVVRAALPSCLVARRSSPPAGRLALPAAPCAVQKA
ncbi:hypothetical protein ABIF38_006046 [Bradyrhizobium japonicum]|uniref:hypothetical protein n=1 Tax=Bradyrhizobium TaxID=374 RepID=UPI00116E0D57|nr:MULTISPECIES: hypothetical protein [Bradyrhizobium]MCP1731647.1 hypothetical protein [Bradyrhizobium elkanii]MCP1932364.1 hypothetical protein [Bradyrhizobium elkanii]MCS3479710.1 hypothetical protein [Bradyrhizobium elkanii]MCS3516513.1 hypothetical protein [Bradyrhizobium elkanii]MCS3575777.1 hypothetical protein [Bradyrhizobium elkanii]